MEIKFCNKCWEEHEQSTACLIDKKEIKIRKSMFAESMKQLDRLIQSKETKSLLDELDYVCEDNIKYASRSNIPIESEQFIRLLSIIQKDIKRLKIIS